MDEQSKSKGAQVIEQLMQQLSPETERYQVLASARRFKSSWVELGEWLARVSRNGQFSEWGYASFEDYCAKEIRIRRQTAEKLLLAYRFMEREEPTLLERRQERPLPDYRSIDLLRQAREEQPFDNDQYQELRRSIVEGERSHPLVAKQFHDMVRSQRPEQRTARDLKNALSTARRLATGLQDLDAVPTDLVQAVDQLVGYLQERVEAETTQTVEEENGF